MVTAKGLGFIQPPARGEDVFAHCASTNMPGFGTLRERQEVSFEVTSGNSGKQQPGNIQWA